ncbi:MAG TPA: 3-oxoacyl-[acyl-carrier-protein] synthase III C-terminal domain-containing protein [Planctomycetota bacterium]|nr:3-oxoacyl-[acyl-carrier-protein] synthase III C-terminal domain-containing protein [Planctomycetota bacterium]
MPRISGIATALPPNVVTQEEARQVCERVHAGRPELLRLLRIFSTCGVEKRHFAFPLEYYGSGKSFDQRNADYIEEGAKLAEVAARACLRRAQVHPDQINHLVFVTTTGLATPSVDALLARRLGLPAEVRRSPLFGLGCAGGAGALIRAQDVLRAYPKDRVLVVALELCGQVFTPRAQDPVDLVGAALFGDGAAAVVVSGDGALGPPGPKILASRSVLFSETEDLMGWRFTSDGMRLNLSERVTGFVRERLRPEVGRFLAEHSMPPDHIKFWILHPGGRRIIEAYRDVFSLSDQALNWTRSSLATVGNLSSASVLFTLADVADRGRPREGDPGFLIALGPGFASEMLLLTW